jgi:transcription initiation factor TFIID TATA-box-binding protein
MKVVNYEPIISNIVATFSLDCELDLDFIVKRARNVEFNVKRFPAIIMRIRNPRCTILIFANGKCVVTGTKNFLDVSRASRRVARLIQTKFCKFAVLKNFKIQNIVSSFSYCDPSKYFLNLFLIDTTYKFCSKYEPELFPGLTFTLHVQGKKTPIIMNIFMSGKIVITGCQKMEQIDFAFQQITEKLNCFSQFKRLKVKEITIKEEFN